MVASWSLALDAAAQAAGAQHFPQPALYVVATPIGNAADISLRALRALSLADAIACEDTRHTQPLLALWGIDRPLMAVHEHNEALAAQAVIARLQRGERVAYVSDAGTPAVSDPGARLVAAVRDAGFRVLPMPGASSVTAALSVAGVTDAAHARGFVFQGFVAPRGKERHAALLALADEPRCVVLLEAPHRIESLAEGLAPLGPRPVTIARELTKQFEQVVTLPCQDFSAWLAAEPARSRGEFVLVLHPSTHAPEGGGAAEARRVLGLLLADLPVKTAAQLASRITGQPRNEMYELALALKAALADDPGNAGYGDAKT